MMIVQTLIEVTLIFSNIPKIIFIINFAAKFYLSPWLASKCLVKHQSKCCCVGIFSRCDYYFNQ